MAFDYVSCGNDTAASYGNIGFFGSRDGFLRCAHGVTGEIAYAPDNLLFIFRGDGDPKGSFVVQARPGLPSEAPSAAPNSSSIT